MLLKKGWSFDMQWVFSSYLIAHFYLCYTMYIELAEPKTVIPSWLLRYLVLCIPVACLYVQAHWSPQLCFSSGHEKIDYLIAWPFWTSNLWLAAGLTELYDRKLDGKLAISGLLIVWLWISYSCWQKATMRSQQA